MHIDAYSIDMLSPLHIWQRKQVIYPIDTARQASAQRIDRVSPLRINHTTNDTRDI
jgi:hypothetical protein